MDSSNFHHTLKICVILIGLCNGSGVLPDLLDGAVGGRVTFTTNLKPTDTPFIVVSWTVKTGNTTTVILIATPTGHTPLPGYEDRVDLERSTGSLKLSGLTLLDSGDYTVVITTATAVIQGLTTLTVYERVSGATINPSSLPIIAGSSVNLTCDAAGFVSLRRWMKDGRPRPVDDDSRVLSLSPVQRTDGGRYLCRISNPVSSQDATYDVIVNSQGSGLTQGLSGGAVAGIVIGLLLVVGAGAGVGVYFGQKKGFKGRKTKEAEDTYASLGKRELSEYDVIAQPSQRPQL